MTSVYRLLPSLLHLMISMLGKNSKRWHFETVFLFFPANRLWRQFAWNAKVYSWEKIEQYPCLSSAEYAQSLRTSVHKKRYKTGCLYLINMTSRLQTKWLHFLILFIIFYKIPSTELICRKHYYYTGKKYIINRIISSVWLIWKTCHSGAWRFHKKKTCPSDLVFFFF